MANLLADAGTMIEQPARPSPVGPTTVAISRLGGMRQQAQVLSFWIQLRGSTQVRATEGRFLLRRGDWMVFDPESCQELQTMRDGLAVGLLVPRCFPSSEGGLLPGAGHASGADIRIALNLWRGCAGQSRKGGDPDASVQPLLLHMRHLQASLHELVRRCPGRTAMRKRQVLARMQRVRMCVEGNTHRNVRLPELAEMSRFSEWWVSKNFRAIYGENVKQASLRLRLQRARDLLENSSMSISELGEACGFQDPCSFARLFKQRHGQTASQWRANSQLRDQFSPSQPTAFAHAFGQDDI